jgi:hypothetical protein
MLFPGCSVNVSKPTLHCGATNMVPTQKTLLLTEEDAPFQNIRGLGTNKLCSWVRPETEKDCADEGQQNNYSSHSSNYEK